MRYRGIKKGIEVYVKDNLDSTAIERKARVLNIYPPPSRWLIVQYEDGDIDQVEESQVTTMFEMNRKGKEL